MQRAVTMAKGLRRSLALLAVTLLASGAPALAESPPSDWRQTVFLYGMGVAIDGDAQIGPLEVAVDVSMSDFFDALDFGAMAAYRIENDEWSFTADATHMSLSESRRTEQGRASASLETEQTTFMVTGGRRVAPHLEVLFSLAYFDVSADLRLRVLQQVRNASREADWIDPMIGLAYDVPVRGKWRFALRGDVGGFGLGSDLTWQALTKFTYRHSERLSWYFGYRAIAYDYEDDGEGFDYQRYDLVQHGPGAGIAFSF